MATILTTNGNISSTSSVFIASSGSTSLVVAGNPLVYLTSSNRVGVNTNSPSYTLDVNGDINSSGIIRSNGLVAITASNIYAASISSSLLTSSGVLFYNAAGTAISNNANRFYWDSTNNRLGVGTSSLNALFHVSANNTQTTNILAEKTVGSTVFSVVPWSSQVYIGAGAYQNAGGWVTQNGGSSLYQLLTMYPGNGVTWFAYGANGTNPASQVNLWNDSGSWVGSINSNSITGSFTGSHTGSVLGTSSWATNSLTSSLLLGSVVSASYAATASILLGSVISASYALSASYAPGGSGLSGGTANYIPLWTGANSQSSSIIYQTGSTLNINQTLNSNYIVDTLSSASLGGLRITVNNANSNLGTSSVASLVLKNTNASLQSHLTFTNNTDQVMGGIMSDFQGNFKWFAKGAQAHQFYTTIAASDTNTKAISNNGFYFDNQGHVGNVGTYPFHVKNVGVDKFWADINGNILLAGQLINSSNFVGANANIVGNGAGTFGGGNVFTAAQVTNANMFGYQAGAQVNYSLAGSNTYTGSNFFGYQAGATFQSANYNYAANSNFIGYQAGSIPSSAGAPQVAHYSNFFGYQAGYGATSACNSIFIGRQAGFNDTVNNASSNLPNGNSSIAIGDYSGTKGFANSISIGRATGNSATAQANIGNVFWINGIQSSGTSSVNVAITSSKVGIGTNTPNSSLQVIGNISASNYTASATGVGFLGTASWSNNAVTASLLLGSVVSASYAATASLLLGSVVSASYALSASYAPSSYVLPSNITASFTGSLTGSVLGTSSWSTNSISSSVINTSNNSLYYFDLSNGSSGLQPTYTDPNLTYNPSTSILSGSSLNISGAGIYMTNSIFAAGNITGSAFNFGGDTDGNNLNTYSGVSLNINPKWCLRIYNSIYSTYKFTAGSFNGGYYQTAMFNGVNNAGPQFGSFYDQNNYTLLTTNANGSVTINTTGSTMGYNFQNNNTSSLYISSSGFVGINNTNPQYQLDVGNGSIYANSAYLGSVGINTTSPTAKLQINYPQPSFVTSSIISASVINGVTASVTASSTITNISVGAILNVYGFSGANACFNNPNAIVLTTPTITTFTYVTGSTSTYSGPTSGSGIGSCFTNSTTSTFAISQSVPISESIGLPIMDLYSVWSGSSSTAYTGIRYNVIDSGSSTNSQYLTINRNGSSLMSVGVDPNNAGRLTFPTVGVISQGPYNDVFALRAGNGIIGLPDNNGGATPLGISWGTSTYNILNTAVDTTLLREIGQPNTLSLTANINGAQGSGSFASAGFRIYNYLSASGLHYERANHYWSGSVYYISADYSGSGLPRNIVFQTSGSNRLFISGSGRIGIGTVTPLAQLHIQGTSSLSQGSPGVLVSQLLSQSAITASQVYGVQINQTFVNTAPNQIQTALKVSPTFTGSFTGSATRNLIADFSTPTAGTQFSVTDVTSGSIYQVNDVSGLPIAEALSDWTFKLWNYPSVVLIKTGSKVAIGSNGVSVSPINPSASLYVSGSISSNGINVSSSVLPNASGSIFYSASKLWVFTGTTNNYGAGAGWATASLSV